MTIAPSDGKKSKQRANHPGTSVIVPRKSRENPAVREFILRNVAQHPRTISRATAEAFGISRTAVARYLKRLEDDGILKSEGRTNARRYELRYYVDQSFSIELSAGLAEDAVWTFRILPLMEGIKRNVVDICQYGFTEMLNNAIDHSGSQDATIFYRENYFEIEMTVWDHGIGIFRKLAHDFKLPDLRSAILELSKGKITSDKTRHSGEGIYFTSRMFDKFMIKANGLFYLRARQDDDDGLIETGAAEAQAEDGTWVCMETAKNAEWTTQEVFRKYQGDNLRFRKAHVPIKLGRYSDEQLVSRSQAKRLLARFESFSEVMLDFEGVPHIGQAFADEIFRVFHKRHPEIELLAVRANADVLRMIKYVQEQAEAAEPQLPFED